MTRLRSRLESLAPWASPIAWIVLLFLLARIAAGDSGGDVHAYWVADGYGRRADTPDAFLYTPPFLLALQPFQLLPWELFRAVWLLAQAAALVWLVGPVIAALVVLPGSWSPVYVDLWYGNLMVFTAAVTVAGFRNPSWWALLPFGKVLPGVAVLGAGVRPMLLVTLVTLASFAIAPGLWADWVDAIRASVANPPENGLAAALVPRVVLAAALIGLWRLRRWRWAVPLAVMIAQPILWFSSLTILLALVSLARQRERVPRPARPTRLPVQIVEPAPVAIPMSMPAHERNSAG